MKCVCLQSNTYVRILYFQIKRLSLTFVYRPNRLLIFHGTDDDNVYLRHSTLLINALVKQGKPYQLQVGVVQLLVYNK